MSRSPDMASMVTAHTVPTQRGALTILSGCMFAGKTTHLFRHLEASRGYAVALFKHVVDTRYCEDAVVSHGGKSMPATAVRSSAELGKRLDEGISTVGIDEGHFFDDDLVPCIQSLTGRGVDVVVTMLDRDSWGRVFPLAKKLNAIADEMVMLHANCARCQRPASRTQRLTPIVNYQMVGGSESYEPRCLECWHPPAEPPPLI